MFFDENAGKIKVVKSNGGLPNLQRMKANEGKNMDCSKRANFNALLETGGEDRRREGRGGCGREVGQISRH